MYRNFDIYKYAAQLLPPILRKKRLFILIMALICYLKVIYSQFKLYAEFVFTTLQANGQTMYLEKALNDRFFFTNREIFLTEGVEPDIFISKSIEMKPVYVYMKSEGNHLYLKKKSEEIYTGAFVVNVPDFLKEYENDIIIIVRRYSPAGKQFKIQYYSYE